MYKITKHFKKRWVEKIGRMPPKKIINKMVENSKPVSEMLSEVENDVITVLYYRPFKIFFYVSYSKKKLITVYRKDAK